ncbi:hypothetical protein HCN44_009503 [Aphidius gifuensis]|uniref:ADAMTS cysteine-rich domain-containing protein n=1 Tax=Aphidius gifuensis TaxID=684658 RepID=A0A835CYY9_APHGI|nr:hypothetical protein HCN44_009503 [Aphidius gifuensis]
MMMIKLIKNYLLRLGAVEDGSCDSNDGFIMSSKNTFDAPFKFNWSNCSIKNIHNFLNNKPSLLSSSSSYSQSKFNNPTCLFNKPHNLKINLTNHWLPGQVLSLNHYCKKLTGNFGVCHQYQVSHCASMLCRDMYDQCTQINWGPALEGSWCHTDPDKRCHQGQCVPFPFQDTTPDDDDFNTTSIENKSSPLDII